MPETKTRTSKKKAGVSTAPFLERPLPDPSEVSLFEEAVNKEAREGEVDANLSLIYNDGEGNIADVSKVKRRRRLKIVVLFKQLIVLTILACGFYGAYYYYFQRSAGDDLIGVAVVAPEKALAGGDIEYRLDYRNSSGMALSDVRIEAVLPPSFVLLSSDREPSGVNSWQIGRLEAGSAGSITITGQLFGSQDSPNIVTARISYVPENFSSAFKKEASANTVISRLGFDVLAEYQNRALVGEDNNIGLRLNAFRENRISDFYLEVDSSDNLVVASIKKAGETPGGDAGVKVEEAGEGRWLVSGLPTDSEDETDVTIIFRIKEKQADKEELKIRFVKKEADGSERSFWEKSLSLEVLKSDLNLSLSVNGDKTDKPADFGTPLEYELSYSNNGESALSDLVLMAVIKGESIDWASFKSEKGGTRAKDAIVWTKEEIPALAEVAPGDSGKIAFTLKLVPFSVSDMGRDQSVTSYAQYGLDSSHSAESDNRSNTIVTRLNSDFLFSEKILYFDEDNIPVGTGPLPPKVGEKTTLHVFWTIKNNLHDLKETAATMVLPAGIDWAGAGNANAGSVTYDDATRTVKWQLGYLPLSVYRADAEFQISLTPNQADANKILVISGGSQAGAVDADTSSSLIRKLNPKTTKLEDDEIAGLSNNGRVSE
ncbi:MAG: hypothetical protein ACM3PZ_02565 [Bacillota bacterium]